MQTTGLTLANGGSVSCCSLRLVPSSRDRVGQVGRIGVDRSGCRSFWSAAFSRSKEEREARDVPWRSCETSMIQKHAGSAMSDMTKYFLSSFHRLPNEAGACPGASCLAAKTAAWRPVGTRAQAGKVRS